MERARLEIVVEHEASGDGDRVRDVEPRNGDRKDGIDGLRARKGQEAEQGRGDDDEPDGVDWCACDAVHPVKDARERECTITRECKGLAGGSENLVRVSVTRCGLTSRARVTMLDPIMCLARIDRKK